MLLTAFGNDFNLNRNILFRCTCYTIKVHFQVRPLFEDVHVCGLYSLHVEDFLELVNNQRFQIVAFDNSDLIAYGKFFFRQCAGCFLSNQFTEAHIGVNTQQTT